MAEGGIFAWKRQKVNQNGPPADYSCLKLSLPLPPKGMVWRHNKETKEWKIVSADDCSADGGGNKYNLKQHLQASNNGNSTTEQILLETTKKIPEKNNFGVKGVDYVEHVVLPTDTFQGLCMRYRISAIRLRQVNMFSGTNLRLAPTKLVMPVNPTLLSAGKIRLQDQNSPEYKTVLFLSQLPRLRQTEAKYYLELANYDVDKAIRDANADLAWEKKTIATEADEQRRIDKANASDQGLDMTLVADHGIPVAIESNDNLEMTPLMSSLMTPLL